MYYLHTVFLFVFSFSISRTPSRPDNASCRIKMVALHGRIPAVSFEKGNYFDVDGAMDNGCETSCPQLCLQLDCEILRFELNVNKQTSQTSQNGLRQLLA